MLLRESRTWFPPLLCAAALLTACERGGTGSTNDDGDMPSDMVSSDAMGGSGGTSVPSNGTPSQNMNDTPNPTGQDMPSPSDSNVPSSMMEPTPQAMPEPTPTMDPPAAAPIPDNPGFPEGRGATLPFREYEVEGLETNGEIIGPTRDYTQIPSEASGRRAVRLNDTGDFVQFQNESQANAIVVRYSIPDTGDGAGQWATLGVYVNGELRTRLNVTSRYSWTYGNEFNGPGQNDPRQGVPHHFFDESHALIGDVPVGATVMLRKDNEDTAEFYVIDVIDLEQVPAPLARPQNYLSITDCGATANDDTDDSAAIQACVDRAVGEGRGVFIPEGTFRAIADPISVAQIDIRGAGMWYSTVYGYNARFDCWGENCGYYDFAVFGDTVKRDDDSPETAFSGNGSSGSTLERIWMEHSKTGYWTGPDTHGLVIRDSRIRNMFADGVNFFGGSTDCVVENTHLRNTGDDALASWSPGDRALNSNNTFRSNTIQVPWMANCFGIYGGTGIRIEDNVCMDTVQYPGILFAQQFSAHGFSGTSYVERTTLIRTGGNAYDQPHGAIKFHAAERQLGGIVVRDVDIVDATHFGVQVQGPNAVEEITLENVNILRPGRSGIHLSYNANGHGNASGVTVVDSPAGLTWDEGGWFDFTQGAGNSGW